MKTLYLSDLDGTLLDNNSKISAKSAEIINKLTDKGVLFTAATARTFSTVMPIFSGVKLNCPLVLMNGVNIFDPKKKKTVVSHPIDFETGHKIVDIFHKYGKYPLIYYENDSKMKVEYQKLLTQHQKDYVGLRQQFYHKDFVQVDEYSLHGNNNFIYVVTLDKEEEIRPIYNEILALGNLDINFYCDTYSGEHFLEVAKKGITKASGALFVKEYTGADKIIAFGDNMNDMPLFEIADECYAVENACDELKSVATGVIGRNDEDAVAKFILSRETQND